MENRFPEEGHSKMLGDFSDYESRHECPKNFFHRSSGNTQPLGIVSNQGHQNNTETVSLRISFQCDSLSRK